MAFGDATLQQPPVPWQEFKYKEYLFRLDGLLGEYRRECNRACLRLPNAPPGVRAEQGRLREALEETAREFAAYAARRREEEGMNEITEATAWERAEHLAALPWRRETSCKKTTERIGA